MIDLKSYSAQTTEGPFLKLNEDDYDFDFNQKLFMIMDGFGGAGVGDHLVKQMKKSLKNNYKTLAADPDITLPFYYHPRNLLEENALVNSVLKTHQHMYHQSLSLPLNMRGGASLLVAGQVEKMLFFIGIGNCRAYHFRRGHLTRILQENSLMSFSLEDYSDSRSQHFHQVPMSAIGLYEELEYQIKEVKIADKDKFILLTDGIYHFISDQELSHAFNNSKETHQQVINDLLKLSNARGNKDNQTAMILEF